MILSNTELEGILREQSQNISIISKYVSEHPSHQLFDVSAQIRDLAQNTATIAEYIKSIAPLINGSAVKASHNESDIAMLINVNQTLLSNVTKMQSTVVDAVNTSFTTSNQIFTALNSLAVIQENNSRQIEQIGSNFREIIDAMEFQRDWNEEVRLLLQFLVHSNPKPGNLNNSNNSKNNNTGKAIKSLSQAVE